MVTIIATDIHVKIIETGLLTLKTIPPPNLIPFNMNANQPANLQGSRQRH